jgi:hypothetical protein
MYISYSGYDLLLECLRAYYHRYIDKTQVLKPDNRVHMLYGDTTGKIFQAFYDDGLWRGNTLELMLGLVKPTLQKVITNEVRKGGVFDWKEPGLKEGTRSVLEVEAEIKATIPRGLASIRQHRLLGNDAKAEVVLDVVIDGHKLGGRSDFIMTRVKPQNDRIIVDGKGSRWRDKYTDHRQLRWYALLHWVKYGKIPDRLGFLYWREEPNNSMDWSTTTPQALNELKTAVLLAIESVEQSNRDILRGADPLKLFPTSPGKNCVRCSYLELCQDGQRAVSDETKKAIAEDRKRGVEDGEVSF